MSFRGRLRVFFTMLVVGPMVAIALIGFALTQRSEEGKTDAGIAAGLRTTLALYVESRDEARPVLRRVTADSELRSALASSNTRAARARMRELLRADGGTVAIVLAEPGGQIVAAAGRRRGIAFAGAPLVGAGGRSVGTLAVSVTEAGAFARRAAELTGLEVSVLAGRSPLASTLPGSTAAARGPADRSWNFEVAGREYRGRVDDLRAPVGPPIRIAVGRDAADMNDAISRSRLAIGAILLLGLLIALACSVFVVRGLQRQIGEFLGAAKRLSRGDFAQPVPTEGRDEFAALGREFNSMSEQLAAKIDEVERKRTELEETIRRVGAAFASGLDRQGVVELTVETALDACEAEAGRALSVDREAFDDRHSGRQDPDYGRALEAAEREAFSVRDDVGRELLEPVDVTAPRPNQRPASAARVDDVFSLAVPMRARLGSRSSAHYVGVVSIARRARPFSQEERELLEYLAGQAVVSIENADLHQTVQRQAVTDELTGLANVRELHSTLEQEVERSRRFSSPLGLVMLDLDDFKGINDSFGHQQGDQVLAAVAGVVRDLSRDIDAPARYGGEELAVILPETDSGGAAQLAERMREAIERLRVPRLRGGGYLEVTASFGVAALPECASDERSLIAAADRALYRAKRGGKNRVARADPIPTPR